MGWMLVNGTFGPLDPDTMTNYTVVICLKCRRRISKLICWEHYFMWVGFCNGGNEHKIGPLFTKQQDDLPPGIMLPWSLTDTSAAMLAMLPSRACPILERSDSYKQKALGLEFLRALVAMRLTALWIHAPKISISIAISIISSLFLSSLMSS